MKILNLTQHAATPEQIAAGVVDATPAQRQLLAQLLTFDTLPSADDIITRADTISSFATGYDAAMIGGAPYLMTSLAIALMMKGIDPLFAFSVRDSVEQQQPDGSVRKVAIFKHAGFVPAVF